MKKIILDLIILAAIRLVKNTIFTSPPNPIADVSERPAMYINNAYTVRSVSLTSQQGYKYRHLSRPPPANSTYCFA